MPISPNQGPTSGGTTVTVTGVNLANATAVHFGDRLATVAANTPTSVSVVPPAGTGVADVTLTGTGLTTTTAVRFGSAAAAFTVVADTTVAAVAPAGAAGSVPVTATTPGGTSNALTYLRVSPPAI
ncbi:IPT/TIG domain-containing protein [Actinacidiphila rubida]|uniref:IPT/TIG domain-containing protein n=1 Tax=Actinacidiphila rubida TaxID=310780 RepID=A0A1H8MM84_9ACTN|nr:IPT/TIG domain-containing protein [Actinacidiphila rubida]SEO18485.1 IPT/TIG domain-containing protein [Actinacidiphila rubida]